MHGSSARRDRIVLAAICVLAVALGTWAASAAFGAFLAVAVVASVWIGSRIGGRRRSTQALTGLVLFAGLCAAVVIVGGALLLLVLAIGGGGGGPID